MEPILEVRNLNSYYSEGRNLPWEKESRQQVLRDVSFAI